MRVEVMSFNIRTAAAPDGDQAWGQRRELVVERIRAAAPDLLGLQECRADGQDRFLRQALADFEFVGVPRQGEGDSALEMAPLLYRRERFQETGRGHFWLSATPAVAGSMSWGAAYPRTATWVRLEPRQGGGAALTFVNTHFDYAGTAREEAARCLHRWLVEEGGAGPLVVTGDFNGERDSEAHRILTADGGLQDAHQAAGVTGGSFHDFGRLAVPEALDWILVSGHFEVESAAVDRSRRDRVFPSDHFPVIAQLELHPGGR